MDKNLYDATSETPSVRDWFDGHSVRRPFDARRIPLMIAGVFCAVLAVVCLSGFTYILFLHPSGDYMSSRHAYTIAAKDIADNRADVTLPLYVPDLDVRGSRVPVKVVGTLSDGTPFDQDAFVSNDGKGLRLSPGTYETYVMGSPISAAGIMYVIPDTHIMVTVADDLTVSYEPVVYMTFGVLGALDVSDEQIEQARAFIINDPDRMQYADTLAEAVRERRNEAQKEIEAANAARQEAAKAVAEQRENTQTQNEQKNNNSTDTTKKEEENRNSEGNQGQQEQGGSDSGGNTGSDSGGNTGGDSGGNTGGDSGGNTGGDTGGSTGGDTGGSTGGDTGGGSTGGGSTGGDTGGSGGSSGSGAATPAAESAGGTAGGSMAVSATTASQG